MLDAATQFHDFERSGWQHAAVQYDAVFQGLTAQSILPLIEAVRSGAGTRLIDLASGPGYVAASAAERDASALAIDFSESMVAMGRIRHPRIELRNGDVEALALPERSFDAAVMAYGLLHLARPDRALAEAFRILRPGGRFAATVWAPPDRAVGFGIILDAVRGHGRLDVPLPSGPAFFRFSDHVEFRRSLEEVGFREVQVREISQAWQLRDAHEFFTTMLLGTVRTAALLAGQDPSQLVAIKAAVTRSCTDYCDAHGLRLPMPAVLAVGTRLAIADADSDSHLRAAP
jgi:ubiquinone/menaquinone biosynthesis C-methylase UbiE